MSYLKKAVKYNESVPYVNCECGHKLNLPVIAGMPMTYECLCGIVYDSRGWIIDKKRP